jgi:two-component sensor histidine kinase
MQDYVQQLTQELARAHNAPARSIAVQLKLAPAVLAIDAAIPCGLIVNELVSNALQHAFPGLDDRVGAGAPGKATGQHWVRVEMAPGAAGWMVLRVADNGCGLPEAAVLKQRRSLGLDVVTALARQIGGTLEFDRGKGTCVTVAFPHPDEGPQVPDGAGEEGAR